MIESYDWQISLVITGFIVLLCIFFGALFKPLPMTTAESCSTEETPNLPDIEENEVLNRTSKNHSFCSDQGLPPVSVYHIDVYTLPPNYSIFKELWAQSFTSLMEDLHQESSFFITIQIFFLI